MKQKMTMILLAALLALSLTGCGAVASLIRSSGASASQAQSSSAAEEPAPAASSETAGEASETASVVELPVETETAESAAQTSEVTATANVTADGAIDATDLFSNRDLRQTADLSEAQTITLSDGSDVTITSEGVYVLTGSAKNATVTVEADKEAKVQLVLDGVHITNEDFPCIYVKSADKVFVTTAESSENTLAVTGTFQADGDTNTDAVIFSKDDLVLNGLGTLTITSTDNGISGKDDVKITGGTLVINCVGNGVEAHDSIRVSGGEITITSSQKDGLHAKDSDDDTVGYIYICGGTLRIDVADDGIHATTIAQIDGGDLTISAAEGIEGTYIQINGGTIQISASDDGINAARKSNSMGTPVAEFNGGEITIVMGQGDTDGVDSNGNLYVNGGTLDITGQSPFDYDGTAEYNGGTIIVNGQETNTITNQFMGGGMGGMGGFGGGMDGGFGGRGRR